MRMALVAAGVLLAHVGDGGVWMRRLDLERSNECIFGFDRNLIRPVADPDPDHVLQGHGCSFLLIRLAALRPSRTHIPRRCGVSGRG
jgi:hypothetical protein